MPNVLWAGTNQADFIDPNGGSVSAQTSGTLWRSGWTLNALHCQTNGSVASPPAHRLRTLNGWTSQTKFWTHAVFAVTNIGASNNAQWMRWLDAGGVARLMIRITGSSGMGNWKLSKINAAGTITDLVTLTAQSVSTSNPLLIDISIDYEVAGKMEVFVGGVSLGSYSGDLTTDGNTTISFLELADGGSNQQTQWSEVIVSDTYINGGGLFVVNGSPTSGGTQAWTKSGSGMAFSPPNAINTSADFITSSTAGQVESLQMLAGSGFNSIIPGGSWTVMAVVTSAWAEQSGSAPQTLDFYFNEGGTGYTWGGYVPGTSYAGSGPSIQPTNPSTSAAWSTTDFASTSYWGVKSAT